MMQEEIVETIFCVHCGEELDEKTGVLASPDWYGNTRYVHYCRNCQQRQFEDFAENTSPAFAYFLCCAAYNLPFAPEAIPVDGYYGTEMNWLLYLQNLETMEIRYGDNDEPSSFAEGLTDLSVLFNGKINATTKFSPGARLETTVEKEPGTRAQRKKWGRRAEYGDEQYQELDRLYTMRSAAFLEGGMDVEMEYNIREICKLDLAYSTAMSNKQYDDAKKIFGMRSQFMADNLMRKRDEAPVAPMKIDTFLSKLEARGYVKNGAILSYDELLEKLRGDKPKYSMSHDILDHIILAMVNCERRNRGLDETDELPYEFSIPDLYDQLKREMTDREKRVVKQLNLKPVQYEPLPVQKKGKKR